MAKKIAVKPAAKKQADPGGRARSRTAPATPSAAPAAAVALVTDAPVIPPPAPVPVPVPVASPFVDDGGVIGLSTFPTDHAGPAGPPPVAPAPKEGHTSLEQANAEAAAIMTLAGPPTQQPAPELVVTNPAAVPVATATPVIPIAPEMEMPLSAEDMLFASLEATGADEQEPGDDDAEGSAAGDFGASASAKIASGTTDFVLKTFGKLSNEFIIDLTTIDEDEISEAVVDKLMPRQVLVDVRAINANNRKKPPFSKDYREMLREPLRKVLEVSGVENLSPMTMLLVVLVTVVAMMYMDTRKRMAENDKFMKLVFKRYGKPAEVITEPQPEAAPAA